MPTSDRKSQQRRINEIEERLYVITEMPAPQTQSRASEKGADEYASRYLEEAEKYIPEESEIDALRRQREVAPPEASHRANKLLFYKEAVEKAETGGYRHAIKMSSQALDKASEMDRDFYAEFAVLAAANRRVPAPGSKEASREEERLSDIERHFQMISEGGNQRGEWEQSGNREAQHLEEARELLPEAGSSRRLRQLAAQNAEKHPEASARAEKIAVFKDAAEKVAEHLPVGGSADSEKPNVASAADVARSALSEAAGIDEKGPTKAREGKKAKAPSVASV